MRTITCDTCDETLEWEDGYRLQHLGGEVGYFHTIMPIDADNAPDVP